MKPLDLDALLGPARAPIVPARVPSAVVPRVRLGLPRLVLLRLGLGRDSMTMLALLAAHRLMVEGRTLGPEDVDAVVFTDVGHEWSFTLELVSRVRRFCERYGLRFIVQEKPPREGPFGWLAWISYQNAQRVKAKAAGKKRATFGEPPWRVAVPGGPVIPANVEGRAASGYYHRRAPLFYDYSAKDAWITHDDATCTINHKIEPNREMLVDLALERFGPKGAIWSDEIRAGRARPHLMLIGYAADETRRLKEAERLQKLSARGEVAVEAEAYPLVEMGIAKGDEQALLDTLVGVNAAGAFVPGGFRDVKKSGCRMCKEQDRAQFWMLREMDPTFFEEVCDLERRAVARTGPWKAVFPYHRSATVRGVPNPILDTWKAEGRLLGVREKDAVLPNPSVWVFIPLEEQVERWLTAYRTTHGRAPDLEEVARKEYRGCAK